jgi:hypothetical protein
VRKTSRFTAAPRETLAAVFHAPPVQEPEGSRRLWYWGDFLFVLLLPGCYFLASTPWLSLLVLITLGMGRFFIARARREWAGAPRRVGIIPRVLYFCLVVMALVNTIAPLTGRG